MKLMSPFLASALTISRFGFILEMPMIFGLEMPWLAKLWMVKRVFVFLKNSAVFSSSGESFVFGLGFVMVFR